MNLSGLNDRQKEAVITTDGPLLVLAGAGSGKTKVLTSRVAYLIGEKNINPYKILAITFTNKAATEMKQRIEAAINMDVSYMWISTFHAMCVRILRYSGKSIGFTSNFVIYDSDDTLRMVKNILADLGLKDDKNYPPRLVKSAISKFKNTCPDGDIFSYCDKQYPILSYRIREIYDAYRNELKNQNAMDFDDILLNTLKLFKEDEEVLKEYQTRFSHILVDEYQDTNMVQYELVNILAKKHRNLFVVGDDDQSIYAFRGANIENILNFEKDYPDAKVIRLEQNYRSDIRILEAANAVIQNNMGRKGKRLWSEIKDGSKPMLYSGKSEYDEGEFIARKAKELKSEGKDLKDMAVLYRSHSLSRIIEEKLRLYGVKYRVYGGLSFYERKEIKDICAYLNLIVNPASDLSLTRIINVPGRKIGAATISKISEAAKNTGLSMIDVISDIEAIMGKQSFKAKTDAFYALYCELSNDYHGKDIHEVIEDVVDKTGYKDMLKAEYPDDYMTRIENIDELINSAYQFEDDNEDATLDDFMQNIALITDMDGEEEESAVTLMTMHAAKGLEYDTVFVAGVEENIFPSRKSMEEDNLEEERRLCYVALTRAKKNLYITNAAKRTYFGDQQMNPHSRFIDEIGARNIEYLNKNEFAEARAVPQQKPVANRFFAGSAASIKTAAPKQAKEVSADFKVGITVSHKVFGKGKILSVLGEGNQKVAEVDFEKGGKKKMFLAFAPLEIIG